MKWCVDFPEESMLVVRPSLNALCYFIKPAAKLLGVLLYRYSIRQEHQQDAENINEVAAAQGREGTQDTSFYIYRRQSQLVADMVEEMTEKTLHDVAIPTLQLLGYLDVDETPIIHKYDLHINVVREALAAYKKSPVELFAFLLGHLQLEKFLIDEQLEEVLINKKKFSLALEKVLIVNRNISNNKRGRKTRQERALLAQSEEPQISIEIDSKIGNEEEGITSSDDDVPTPAEFAYQIEGYEAVYHDFCVHAQDRGVNDGLTFKLIPLADVPQDKQCDICYGPIHEAHRYNALDDIKETHAEVKTDLQRITGKHQAVHVANETQYHIANSSAIGNEEEEVVLSAPRLRLPAKQTPSQHTPGPPAPLPLAAGVEPTSRHGDAGGVQASPSSLDPEPAQASSIPPAATGTLSAQASGFTPPKRPRAKRPPTMPEEPPKITLTVQEQAFWALWCGVWFNLDIAPDLTMTAYGHVKRLAPYITTAELLNSLIEYARKDLQESKGIKRKAVQLGNLVNSYRGWKQEQTAQGPPAKGDHSDFDIYKGNGPEEREAQYQEALDRLKNGTLIE